MFKIFKIFWKIKAYLFPESKFAKNRKVHFEKNLGNFHSQISGSAKDRAHEAYTGMKEGTEGFISKYFCSLIKEFMCFFSNFSNMYQQYHKSQYQIFGKNYLMGIIFLSIII